MTDEKILKLLTLDPMSSEYLLERGKCCGCRCTNCPYDPNWVVGTTKVNKNKKKNRKGKV